jgi:transposase
MDYPPAVIDKAQRLEQLLRRVAAGEAFEAVCAELTLSVTAADWPKWQARYVAGGRQWAALLDGRFGHTHTINSAMREWLYNRKRQDPTLRAPALAAALTDEFGVSVAAGHVNHLLRKVGLTSPPGRPYKHRPLAPGTSADAPTPPTLAGPTALANAGLFFPRGRTAADGGGQDHRDDPGDDLRSSPG